MRGTLHITWVFKKSQQLDCLPNIPESKRLPQNVMSQPGNTREMLKLNRTSVSDTVSTLHSLAEWLQVCAADRPGPSAKVLKRLPKCAAPPRSTDGIQAGISKRRSDIW